MENCFDFIAGWLLHRASPGPSLTDHFGRTPVFLVNIIDHRCVIVMVCGITTSPNPYRRVKMAFRHKDKLGPPRHMPRPQGSPSDISRRRAATKPRRGSQFNSGTPKPKPSRIIEPGPRTMITRPSPLARRCFLFVPIQPYQSIQIELHNRAASPWPNEKGARQRPLVSDINPNSEGLLRGVKSAGTH